MINLIEAILKNHSSLKPEYDKEYQSWLQYLRKEAKEPLKEHEWWKEYIEEPETINDLDIATKYRILEHLIIDLFKDHRNNEAVLKSIFETIEDSLKDATPDELGEVEILLLEGIENCLMKDEQASTLFHNVLGPQARLLHERNNAFWEQLAAEQEKQRTK